VQTGARFLVVEVWPTVGDFLRILLERLALDLAAGHSANSVLAFPQAVVERLGGLTSLDLGQRVFMVPLRTSRGLWPQEVVNIGLRLQEVCLLFRVPDLASVEGPQALSVASARL